MKKLLIIPVLLLIFSSCRNDEIYPQPDPEYAPVATVAWTELEKSFFNAADIENAVFEYVLDGEDFGHKMAEVASIEVFIEMNGQGRQPFGTFSDLPVTITLPSGEAAGLFGMQASELKAGDVFTFSFAVNAMDGRRYSLYTNNLCNLIRIIGDCSLDAMVLTPVIAEAAAVSAHNRFSLGSINTDGDDQYQFSLNKRDFINAGLQDIEIELTYMDASGTDYGWKTLKEVPAGSVPSNLMISAKEAATLFGKTTADLKAGDMFMVRFVFDSQFGKFTTYGSGLCGQNFPSTIVHPLHKGITGTIPNLGFENPMGTATAPPPTSVSGTCTLEINVVN